MATELFLTEGVIKSRTSSKVFKRGESYYRNDHIVSTVRRGDTIEASCYGSYPEPYRLSATLSAEGIVNTRCSCEYDWGGDCKHIVAMLLTYLHEPDLFAVRRPIKEILAEHDKDTLIDLMAQMLKRYPDLQALVERPVPKGDSHDAASLNLKQLRVQLERALESPPEWGKLGAEKTIYELTNLGERFAENGDYRSALLIYCMIIDTCNESDYLNYDEDGEYCVAVGNTVEQLDEARKSYDLSKDDSLRRDVNHVLLGTDIADINFGGVDYGYPANKILMEIVHPEDIPALREWIEKEKGTSESHYYSSFRIEAYERILLQFDKINPRDPEETLKQLEADGLYSLLFDKLMALEHQERAMQVLDEHIVSNGDLHRAIWTLREHGMYEKAIEITKAKVDEDFNSFFVGDLMRLYEEVEDYDALLALQRTSIEKNPSERMYIELKTTAQKLESWEDIRPQIINLLAEKESFDVLTAIHLREENWEAAWETVGKLNIPRSTYYGRYSVYYGMDYRVAEATSEVMPARAIPVYLKYAHAAIGGRNRDQYATAASLLKTVKRLYEEHLGELETWFDTIETIRSEYKRLPALQDELNKAGL